MGILIRDIRVIRGFPNLESANGRAAHSAFQESEFCHQNPIAGRKTPEYCSHPCGRTPRIADDFRATRRTIPSFAPKNRVRLFATKLGRGPSGRSSPTVLGNSWSEPGRVVAKVRKRPAHIGSDSYRLFSVILPEN
jgi:hypothetical protein